MKHLSTKATLFCSLLMLSGCGEGYELVKIGPDSGYIPYTMDRTAAPGYAYVKAQLLPEKDIVIRPVQRERSLQLIEPEVKSEPLMKKADEVFEHKLLK